MIRLLPLLALALISTAAHAQGVTAALDDLALEAGGEVVVEPTALRFTAEDFMVEAKVDLEAGDYTLLVAGDGFDVDPVIFDGDMSGIGAGFDVGDTEVVEFTADGAGTYTISFTSDCDGTCAFGFSVVSR